MESRARNCDLTAHHRARRRDKWLGREDVPRAERDRPAIDTAALGVEASVPPTPVDEHGGAPAAVGVPGSPSQRTLGRRNEGQQNGVADQEKEVELISA